MFGLKWHHVQMTKTTGQHRRPCSRWWNHFQLWKYTIPLHSRCQLSILFPTIFITIQNIPVGAREVYQASQYKIRNEPSIFFNRFMLFYFTCGAAATRSCLSALLAKDQTAFYCIDQKRPKNSEHHYFNYKNKMVIWCYIQWSAIKMSNLHDNYACNVFFT